MILTIITLAVLVIGILLSCNAKNEIMDVVGLVLFACGGLVGFIMLLFIIFAHTGVDVDIEQNRIEYEALCERLEIADSDYEDVSKSDVVKDVADWNKNVYSYKHWAYSPWTNWFYSTRVADELEVIERGQNETTR